MNRPDEPSFESFFTRARCAHHPASAAFGDHVVYLGGIAFCRGCCATLLGATLAAVAAVASGWTAAVGPVTCGIVLSALLLPTVWSTLGRPSRFASLVSRFSLGVLLASAAAVLLSPQPWWARATIVVVFVATRVPLSRHRRQRDGAVAVRDIGEAAEPRPLARSALAALAPLALGVVAIGALTGCLGSQASDGSSGATCDAGFRCCVQPGPETCCPSETPFFCPSRSTNRCLNFQGCSTGQCPGNCFECRPGRSCGG